MWWLYIIVFIVGFYTGLIVTTIIAMAHYKDYKKAKPVLRKVGEDSASVYYMVIE